MAEGALGPPPWRAAVLGSPVGHSLSPVLHRAGYAALGLTDWSYDAIECDEAGFADRFGGLGPQWRGLSLTMPLKRVVIPLLAELSPLAAAVGAVNTVTWRSSGHDGPRAAVGDNTDVHGIVAALGSAGVTAAETAGVLGAGATAGSSVAALAELGCSRVLLLARSAARAADALAVADRVGVKASVVGLDQVGNAVSADVLISTLPPAAAATWAGTLPASVGPGRVLLDVTYDPWPTAMATAWAAAGGTVVSGFEMLLHQAAAQFERMTGHPAPVAHMRAAGLAALPAR